MTQMQVGKFYKFEHSLLKGTISGRLIGVDEDCYGFILLEAVSGIVSGWKKGDTFWAMRLFCSNIKELI